MSIDLLFQAACAQDAAARTDGQLLEHFLARRDEAAFAALLKRHGPMVLGVCRRLLGDETDAEDAFQATFLVLIGKARLLKGRAILGDWLHQVARYSALKARVARARRRTKEQTVARPEAAPNAGEPNEWLPRLDDELRRLPAKYRLPLMLCDLEGKTRRQAADQLGWPEGTVAGRLARARALLARRLLRGTQLGGRGLPGLLTANAAHASVPLALADSMLRAAVQLAAGGTAPRVLSANALTLAHGVMLAMFWKKVKIGALALLAFVVLSGGGGLAFRALAGERQAQPIPRAVLPAALQAQGPAQIQAQPQTQAVIGEDLFTLKGHTQGISSLAFSTDRKRLASASSDGTVIVWDAPTGKELLTFRGHSKQVWCVAFSSARDQIASASADGTVKIWDATNGKERLTFIGHSHIGSSVHSVAFSPDGNRLASGNGSPGGTKSVKVWDATTGKEEFTRELAGMVASVAFSPDGKLLATASGDRKLTVWNAATGKAVASISQPNQYYWSVAFCPDSKRLVSANEDKTVTVWDAATGQELLVLKGHTREVTSAAFSPDGKLIASAGYDATLRLWDATAGKELDRRGGYAREVHSVAFNSNGTQLATGSADGLVKVWQIKPGPASPKP